MRLAIIAISLFLTVQSFASPDTLMVESSGIRSLVGVWQGNAPGSDVVVWFHGGMRSDNCLKGLVAADDFSQLFPQMTVISASACRDNHWATMNMVNIIDAALDSVAARQKRLVNTVSLVGISDGSLGVIVYSMYGKRNVKNRLLMSTYGPALGEAPQVAVHPKLKQGKWRFLQGGADRLYPSVQSLPWIESFCKTQKGDCEPKFDQKGEHDWLYWKQNRMDWIREAILKSTP